MFNTVLVTGGAGFIGSHMVDLLIENNYRVIVLDNLVTGNIENLNQKAIFYNVDILSDKIEDIVAKEAPDFILHFAAQISVANAAKDPINDANENIIATLNMLRLGRKYKVKKFVAASSAAVYGNPKYLPIDEKHPTEPISVYGLSKLTMEKYIKLSGLDYLICRFSNVFGERQTTNGEAGVVTIFEDAIKNNKQIKIFGDGEQIRDFIYVKDIVNIVYKLLLSDVKNETINISSNSSTTINQLFSSLKDKYDYQLQPEYCEKRIGDIDESILDNTLLMSFINDYAFQKI